MTKPPHPCAGLPRAARKAFDTIAAGGELEATAGTLELLAKRGLIAGFDEKHVFDDGLPPLITTKYSIPIGHYVAWCENLTHN